MKRGVEEISVPNITLRKLSFLQMTIHLRGELFAETAVAFLAEKFGTPTMKSSVELFGDAMVSISKKV